MASTEDFKEFEQLLEKFSKVHIPKEEKTFMGICQYPGSRFEEICSRILAFYFNPEEEHGFRHLWFYALNQCIGNVEGYNAPQDIKIQLEQYTYYADESNKRIDIIIETEDTVYAIENKIGASLYNNLAVYAQHIDNCDEYKGKNKVKIVLTAHTLSPDEKRKADTSGFAEITYKTLFEKVNAISGDYIAGSNLNQVAFMFDFMKTLNNKMNFMENKERAEFFSRNKESVEKMIYQYQKWREEVSKQQTDAIADLFNEIKKKADDDWWIYQGGDLGIVFNDKTDKKIGIESWYVEEGQDALAKFCIYITTWNVAGATGKQCWSHYNDVITKKYGSNLEIKDNRVYLCIKEFKKGEIDDIIETLSECYTFLKIETDKVAKEQ